ncbi:hypothetical protein HG531_004738 [Fusarium graminearum]|nr:hypothetical protein HG531_004738 [Fusarium graminearum]
MAPTMTVSQTPPKAAAFGNKENQFISSSAINNQNSTNGISRHSWKEIRPSDSITSPFGNLEVKRNREHQTKLGSTLGATNHITKNDISDSKQVKWEDWFFCPATFKEYEESTKDKRSNE